MGQDVPVMLCYQLLLQYGSTLDAAGVVALLIVLLLASGTQRHHLETIVLSCGAPT